VWVGPLTFNLPITNDDPCGAIDLPVGNGCNFFATSNVNATTTVATNYGYSHPSCSFASAPKDVWYKFTTNATGAGSNDVVIGNAGFTIGQIRVFSASGACNSTYTEVRCATRPGGIMPTVRVNNLSPNTTYYMLVAGDFNNDPLEPFSICVSSDVANSTAYSLAEVPLIIMPNPATGTAVVSGIKVGAQIKIVNGIGQVAYVSTATSNQALLNLVGFVPGVYRVLVITNGHSVSKSLVVQ
jgi:hypothetical protein